jgi:hypothetical protein
VLEYLPCISRDSGSRFLGAFPILPIFCLILFEIKNSEMLGLLRRYAGSQESPSAETSTKEPGSEARGK